MSTSTERQQREKTRYTDGTQRVLHHGRASTTSSIAQSIVIKHDQLFFLCNADGDVPMDHSHGLGLYYHDCRYLDGYELRVGGMQAERLASTAAAGFWASFELTNPDFESDAGRLMQKERIGIKWERTLDAPACALHDVIALTNFGVDAVQVPLTIRLRSTFESLFEVRGAQPKKRGTLHQPTWIGSTLRFRYDGADQVRRALSAAFDPAPHHTGDDSASYELSIDAQATITLSVSLQIEESERDAQVSSVTASANRAPGVRRATQESSDAWLNTATRVRSDDEPLNLVLDRSMRDLHLLQTTLEDKRYFAAGVPWYVTLFGRDSIITALEALAFMPDSAESTVRLLASFQGTHEDAWRDEAPGKIMHELRIGEMAHLNEVPQTPYYGSVDATPLFLILLARHAAWTGTLGLFNEVKPHVEAALNWIDDSVTRAGGGYLAYATNSSRGLANQGWKDSGDSIMNRDGTLATPPIALVEVQGYVYLAKRGIAELYRRAGDSGIADRLAGEAEGLRERFERDFWQDDLDIYALALQQNNRPAAVVSSNPAQALWTGIASPPRARHTVTRLMRDDMFSGWGIRTLSTKERRYNPIGYHNGTIWPHDNAIAVAGFRAYGCVEEAVRVIGGIVDAATHFAHHRLPEVFAGFSRREFAVPVHYPVACHPQAWAAGAVPFMVQSVLGLEADAFNHRLRVSSPVLPPGVQTLSIDGLRVGNASAKLVFTRDAQGRASLDDVDLKGHLEVITD